MLPRPGDTIEVDSGAIQKGDSGQAIWRRPFCEAFLERAYFDVGAEDPEVVVASLRWLRRTDDEWIFSFENICDYLGKNPSIVRKNIMQNVNSAAVAEWKRMEEEKARQGDLFA